MKSSPQFSYSSSSTSTLVFTFNSDHSNSPQQPKEIPVETPVPITVHLPDAASVAAATKIQSVYRAHVIRDLYKQISDVNSSADHLQHLIQRQETVDAIRNDEKEKLRINETLMGLLLKLDSVPGLNPTVREGRRTVSRRIVGLQEIVDGISETKMEDDGEWWCGQPRGIFTMKDWDEVVEMMEEEVCKERGGAEMERFCAEYLGFRCLQRFLRE